MVRFLFLNFGYCFFGWCCNQQLRDANHLSSLIDSSSTAGVHWTRIFEHAEWTKSYNYQMFSTRDSLWMFHPDGVWNSADGIQWTRTSLGNPINNQAFLDYVEFKNCIYGLGYFEGNIERYTFRPIIFRTCDFQHWDTLSLESNLPERFFYHPFVWLDKIWIFGGSHTGKDFDDLWNSSDGVHWQKVKDGLPMGKRSGSQIIQHNKMLYLLNHDVWTSTDAIHWKNLTKFIAPGEQLFGYTAIVFDQRIWLLGCNRDGLFSSQVLSSEDGIQWKSEQAPWLPRGGLVAARHRNKVFITGGKYGGTPQHTEFRYDNDLWVMDKE